MRRADYYYTSNKDYSHKKKREKESGKSGGIGNLVASALILTAFCLILVGALYVVRYSPAEFFMNLRDRKAPVVTAHSLVALNGATYSIEDFVDGIIDTTDVELFYAKAPDFDTDGIQEIIIRAVDKAGNYSDISVNLEVQHDTEAPVIYGEDEVYVYAGDSLSYRNLVTVEDDSGEECDLDIDNSWVDLNNAGSYEVYYTATDKSGNSAEKTVHIYVVETGSPEYYWMKADEICDAIIAQIITDDMDDLHKVWAVYLYVREIPYILMDYTRDYVIEGYKMLSEYRGNCFGSYAAVRLLLDRLGIPNIPVATDENWTTHFWNMVSVDGGNTWYHVDATNWTEWAREPNMCMISDTRIQQISADHNGTHRYVTEDYPATPYNSLEVPADIDEKYGISEQQRLYENWYWNW